MAHEIPLEIIQSKFGEQINVYVFMYRLGWKHLKKMLEDGISFCFGIIQFTYHRDSVPLKIWRLQSIFINFLKKHNAHIYGYFLAHINTS